VVLHFLVLCVPFLQRAFGTTALSFGGWGVCVSVASSVLWLQEVNKAITRAWR
jgi:Ca2+-transporting ATPase